MLSYSISAVSISGVGVGASLGVSWALSSYEVSSGGRILSNSKSDGSV